MPTARIRPCIQTTLPTQTNCASAMAVVALVSATFTELARTRSSRPAPTSASVSGMPTPAWIAPLYSPIAK